MSLIGVDTNVLLRVVVNDDPDQSKRVRSFLAGLEDKQHVYVNTIVLVELVWALRTQMGFQREPILDLVGALLERSDIEFSDRESVLLALGICRRRKVDFADALIAASNNAAGCARTVTFDQGAAKAIPSLELLA